MENERPNAYAMQQTICTAVSNSDIFTFDDRSAHKLREALSSLHVFLPQQVLRGLRETVLLLLVGTS